MGYEIKQQDWLTLTENAQREIYNYFLFIKQRYEIQAHTVSNDNNIFTLASHTDSDDESFTLASHNSNVLTITSSDISNSEYLSDDDVNKVCTISQ
jgi:hypothetical protein